MKLTIFNGSPRGPASNTLLLMGQFLAGFEAGGAKHETHLLFKQKALDRQVEAFARGGTMLLCFPLYVHAMPGLVKRFIEAVSPLPAERGGRLGFIVQSGFPEAHNSRYLEAYLERLPRRIGCEYIGTVIKGGVEGMQMKPGWMTRGMMRDFRRLGEGFARDGGFDPALVKRLASPERLGFGQRLFYRIMGSLGLADYYWDTKLKENGAFDRRFDAPYMDQ